MRIPDVLRHPAAPEIPSAWARADESGTCRAGEEGAHMIYAQEGPLP